jgi:hypothetical protein
MPDESPAEPIGYDPAADRKLILETKKMDLKAESEKLALEAEQKKIRLEVGWMGKVLGSATHAPYNLACLTLILTFIAGFVATAFPNASLEFWKLIILPTITFVFEFVSGRTRSPGEKQNGA